MTDRTFVFSQLHSHLKQVREQGYSPIYIGLYGSQNYGLDTPESDVDTKAIVLPTLEQIVKNTEPVSTVIEMEDGAQCDVKDVRVMFQNFKKQNINFLEILFTDFYLYSDNFWDELSIIRENKENIARIDMHRAINAIAGMVMQKYKALEHPYPKIKDKIDKYGYDPKQLHHIVRLREFMERFARGENFEECLAPQHKDFLLKIKSGVFGLDDARQMAQTELTKVDKLKEKFFADHPNDMLRADYSNILDEACYKLIKKSLTIELLEGGMRC